MHTRAHFSAEICGGCLRLIAGQCARLWPVFVLGLLPLRLSGGAADPVVPKEYRVKAAFLLNFTKFVEWPSGSFPDETSPIVIGLFGTDPFDGQMEEVVRGRMVNGRTLVVERITSAKEAQSAHLLFIPEEADREIPALLQSLRHVPVVTVGESERFGENGGMITFVRHGDKVRFEINIAAAQSADLKISAQLQKLARRIRK